MNNALIDEFLDHGGKKPYSKNTRDRYRRALVLVFESFSDMGTLNASSLRDWLAGQDWALNTQWIAYNAIKGFLRYHYGASHPALSLRLPAPPVPPKKGLNTGQVQKLLVSFDTTTRRGLRDLAICGVFLDCALRVAEVARLDLAFLDMDDRTLSVIVKGGKWDTRGFSPDVAVWLAEWLFVRNGIVRPGVSSVFLAVGGRRDGGSALGYGLSVDGLKAIVKDWQKTVGFKLHPHKLRHTFATETTRNGAPQRIAMQGGGWLSPSVFKRYTQGITIKDMDPYYPVAAAMRVAGESG